MYWSTKLKLIMIMVINIQYYPSKCLIVHCLQLLEHIYIYQMLFKFWQVDLIITIDYIFKYKSTFMCTKPYFTMMDDNVVKNW